MASLSLSLVSLGSSGHHIVHHSMMNGYNPACIVRGVTEDLHRNTSTAEQSACWQCCRRRDVRSWCFGLDAGHHLPDGVHKKDGDLSGNTTLFCFQRARTEHTLIRVLHQLTVEGTCQLQAVPCTQDEHMLWTSAAATNACSGRAAQAPIIEFLKARWQQGQTRLHSES